MRNQPPDPKETKSNLRVFSWRGNVVGWSVAGVIASLIGLLLLTGLSASPWLFLLYPLLIAVLLLSLGALALHLLHRF